MTQESDAASIAANVARQREAAAKARAELRGEAAPSGGGGGPAISYPSGTSPVVAQKLASGEARTVSEARAIAGYESAGYKVGVETGTGNLMAWKDTPAPAASAGPNILTAATQRNPFAEAQQSQAATGGGYEMTPHQERLTQLQGISGGIATAGGLLSGTAGGNPAIEVAKGMGRSALAIPASLFYYGGLVGDVAAGLQTGDPEVARGLHNVRANLFNPEAYWKGGVEPVVKSATENPAGFVGELAGMWLLGKGVERISGGSKPPGKVQTAGRSTEFVADDAISGVRFSIGEVKSGAGAAEPRVLFTEWLRPSATSDKTFSFSKIIGPKSESAAIGITRAAETPAGGAAPFLSKSASWTPESGWFGNIKRWAGGKLGYDWGYETNILKAAGGSVEKFATETPAATTRGYSTASIGKTGKGTTVESLELLKTTTPRTGYEGGWRSGGMGPLEVVGTKPVIGLGSTAAALSASAGMEAVAGIRAGLVSTAAAGAVAANTARVAQDVAKYESAFFGPSGADGFTSLSQPVPISAAPAAPVSLDVPRGGYSASDWGLTGLNIAQAGGSRIITQPSAAAFSPVGIMYEPEALTATTKPKSRRVISRDADSWGMESALAEQERQFRQVVSSPGSFGIGGSVLTGGELEEHRKQRGTQSLSFASALGGKTAGGLKTATGTKAEQRHRVVQTPMQGIGQTPRMAQLLGSWMSFDTAQAQRPRTIQRPGQPVPGYGLQPPVPTSSWFGMPRSGKRGGAVKAERDVVKGWFGKGGRVGSEKETFTPASWGLPKHWGSFGHRVPEKKFTSGRGQRKGRGRAKDALNDVWGW